MSWEVRVSNGRMAKYSPFSMQIHYNQPDVADLHTYLEDPSVFTVKDGHVAILQGEMAILIDRK